MKKTASYLVSLSLMVSLFGPLSTTVKANSIIEPQYQEPISVRLGYSALQKPAIQFTISGNYILKTNPIKSINKGTYEIRNIGGQIKLYQYGNEIYDLTDPSLTLYPPTYNDNYTMKLGNYQFLGNMTFRVNGSNVLAVNTLEHEDYLLGVVPYEMSESWPLEALKAQSITARTYSEGDIGKEIDNGQSYQVYNGYNQIQTRTKQAIEETAGQVITYNQQPIGKNAVFSASNGGTVLSKINSWGTASWNNISFLTRVSDPYDFRSAGNPHTSWQFSLSKQQIDTASLDLKRPELWWNSTQEKDTATLTNGIKNFLISQNPSLQNHDIKITSIDYLGFTNPSTDTILPNTPLMSSIQVSYMKKNLTTPDNPYQLDVDGNLIIEQSQITKRAYDFYTSKVFGTNGSYPVLRSANVKAVNQTADQYTITGSGWGHGIGMSQYGAKQMAAEGKKADEIISFYYPGTSLTPIENISKPLPIPTPEPVIEPVPTPDTTSPDNVTGFREYSVTSSSSLLSWNISTSNDVKEYRIYSGTTLIAIVSPTTKSFQLLNLNEGTFYRFGIKTVDKAGNTSSLITTSFTTSKKPIQSKTYQVKRGDTLYRIATNNHLSVQQLMSINNLKSTSLYVGQILKVSVK